MTDTATYRTVAKVSDLEPGEPDAAGQRAFQVAGRGDRDPGRAEGDAGPLSPAAAR